MAKIFLSYAREDSRRAERIASVIEKVGHEVWWDRHIDAGSSFSSAIDTALAEAELVVVLWSKHSVGSDWVRDEAATGRDSGRLLPVLIEPVEPPLGFRQYQAVPLTRSRQSTAPLVAAIAKRLGDTDAMHVQTDLARSSPAVSRSLLVLAAFLIALAIAAAWLFRSPSETHTIAVVPSSLNDARSTELARSVARDLGRLRAGPIGSLTIVDPMDSKAKAEFRVEVGESGTGKDLRADVAITLLGTPGLLWSSVIDEPGGQAVDLRQQVSAQIGGVLSCLAELGDLRRTVSPQSLSLYLRGCSLGSDSEAIAVFRQLTEREPRFGPGWANLAMVIAWNVPTALPSDQRALIEAGRSARDKALQFGPDLPETAVAVAIMRPSGQRRKQRSCGSWTRQSRRTRIPPCFERPAGTPCNRWDDYEKRLRNTPARRN
ncbi:toll/interleukin-1 receptor domain-containing protein [Sphingomonas sp. HDW15A]|uniref:toll/interleukin-1 receptor domain-containing protein n=1 Tax=Sphingomonas sp. HDW15A TaxID=2714942 RepID=UPI001407D63A|nr:toll/interleukin-1 receptor domain-containing protein [Sphingomonas sp. HDW15A]QIK95813.1 toll/interleukin-1 receptor domain-containing protein [Sphingomonas sp. HDW15A]